VALDREVQHVLAQLHEAGEEPDQEKPGQ